MNESLYKKRKAYSPDLLPELKQLDECQWIVRGESLLLTQNRSTKSHPLRVAIVLSGGPAPGGHSVVAGVYDALKSLNSKSNLYGVVDGPQGLLDKNLVEFDDGMIDAIRHIGGFHVPGTGRKKLKTDDEFAKVASLISEKNLDGIIFVGGDDTNTTAFLLGSYLEKNNCLAQIIGIPKTIDFDLQGGGIEGSFGFDSACKVYSEMVGNLAFDAMSAKKYWFFVKMMGRSASHIALEVALATRPNIALIGEEIEEKNLSLKRIVDLISDIVEMRAKSGKNYGICLIPEGLIEFIPEVKSLVLHLNRLLALGGSVEDLPLAEKGVWGMFPENFQNQLLKDRDSHGNVPLSQIATEELLIEMVQENLRNRKSTPSFYPVPTKYGYDGRCGYPSNFDATYCYNLGHIAALLVRDRKSKVVAAVENLAGPLDTWRAIAIPLKSLITEEERNGEFRSVIRKVLVSLKQKPFKTWKSMRDDCAQNDKYLNPGPMQFDDKSDNFNIVKTLSLLLRN